MLHALICIFSEYQKVLNLARDGAKLTPNSFSNSISPCKSSGRAALENADTVNMMALPAKTFSTA